MKIKLQIHLENKPAQQAWFTLPLSIGRDKSNQIVLKSWRVAKQHAQLIFEEDELFVVDHGTIVGTLLNGQRVFHKQLLAVHDQLIMGPCLLRVLQIDTAFHSLAPSPSAEEAVHKAPEPAEAATMQPVQAETTTLSVAQDKGSTTLEQVHPSAKEEPLQTPVLTPSVAVQLPSEVLSLNEQEQAICRELHGKLIEALDLRRNNVTVLKDHILRKQAQQALQSIVADHETWQHIANIQDLCQHVIDEAVGLGPLEALLANTQVSEIMVNCYNEIYIEKAGCLQRYPLSFSSEQSVHDIIERIVAPIGRRIDESSPMVDARLKDGSRVNAVIPPIALKGANLTIRKFPQHRPQMQDLLRLGSLDHAMANFLAFCVENRMNMIVSGGTGSGKTTLLNILSNCIPAAERIITIEDAAELRLNHQHLISLEARPPNVEGKGAVTIRDLVKNALRMRPDRIVVGECRGAEAFDMLSAMNTGHEGSLTTLHANTPRDALARLETMILMAGMDLPLQAIREHMSSSIDFIVQQSRLSNGARVISSIVEVGAMENGVIKIQELFRFERTADQGCFVGAGILPDHFEKLREQGLVFPAEHFAQKSWVNFAATQQQGL
ncbi:ATPase, T2SS/T4P/T4SS family [Brackiella oedipodis]|uniref:ATPase, T2SS/T4P/T4SS family n=1 Tax=Brackiella oedipodis TaxID=124225 RepID=UPI000570AD40|nr:ATPase, T2SS/T4P/T4SS family [Brackiella oedipodis]